MTRSRVNTSTTLWRSSRCQVCCVTLQLDSKQERRLFLKRQIDLIDKREQGSNSSLIKENNQPQFDFLFLNINWLNDLKLARTWLKFFTKIKHRNIHKWRTENKGIFKDQKQKKSTFSRQHSWQAGSQICCSFFYHNKSLLHFSTSNVSFPSSVLYSNVCQLSCFPLVAHFLNVSFEGCFKKLLLKRFYHQSYQTRQKNHKSKNRGFLLMFAKTLLIHWTPLAFSLFFFSLKWH